MACLFFLFLPDCRGYHLCPYSTPSWFVLFSHAPPPSSQPSGNGVAYQVEYHNDGPNTGTYNFAAQFSFDNTYQTFTSTVVNFGETLNIDASFPGESHDK